MEKEWIIPKTDWKPTDRFNIEDFNRIKNNISYLHEKAKFLYKEFSIENMGEDIKSYFEYWDVDKFNSFEKNLEIINNNIFTQNFGNSQKFYQNGIFIKYDELNRIEKATLSMKNLLEKQLLNKTRIEFRLGTFKAVKV